MAVEQVPLDLIVVGHVTDAWGIRGGIRIAPYSPDANALISTKQWWLEQDGTHSSHEVLSAKAHGENITAQLVGFVDRNNAEKLKGARVAIARSRFPVLNDDEYYWIDLIGLDVVNESGEMLGKVTGLMDNGAHQILEVAATQEDGSSDGVASKSTGTNASVKPRLIPFVSQFVKNVDRGARRITVDWGLDY